MPSASSPSRPARRGPRGPVAWLRRRVLPRLASLCALLGIGLLGAWIAGRVLTDSSHWSQYLYWMPPIAMVGGAWGLLVLSALLAKLSRRLGGLLLRPLLLVLALGCTGYLLFGVWHLQRALGGSGEKAPGAIRVGNWNMAGKAMSQEAPVAGLLYERDADIVLLANVEWGSERQRVLEQFAHYAPDERVRWVNYSYRIRANPAHYRIEGQAMIASRFPMTRTGMVRFGSSQPTQVLSHTSSDLGWVKFAQFDLDPQRTDDRPLSVWFVDLPSNPVRWKMDVMREARQAIDGWDGSGWVMGRHVWEQRTDEGGVFPEPDLIIGDFNTPAGSGSLGVLAPGFKDAFAQAGHGRGRSYVVKEGRPLERAAYTLMDMHIDQALTGEGTRATHYELIDRPRYDHALQLVDIVPPKP